jgi:hypothetical protein
LFSVAEIILKYPFKALAAGTIPQYALLKVRGYEPYTHPLSWRTTPCRLSATTYAHVPPVSLRHSGPFKRYSSLYGYTGRCKPNRAPSSAAWIK